MDGPILDGPISGSFMCSEAITVMTILGIEEHRNTATSVRANDSNTSCKPCLGLGNTARTDLLEGGAWGAPETVTTVGRDDSNTSCEASLGQM